MLGWALTEVHGALRRGEGAVHHARLATAHVATWISDECGLPLAAQAAAEHATAHPLACTGDCCKRHPGACRARHEFLSR